LPVWVVGTDLALGSFVLDYYLIAVVSAKTIEDTMKVPVIEGFLTLVYY